VKNFFGEGEKIMKISALQPKIERGNIQENAEIIQSYLFQSKKIINQQLDIWKMNELQCLYASAK